MGRKKQFQEAARVSIVISEKQLNRVREMAILMSHKQGKQIGVSEALRMAIEAVYPLPKEKQLNLNLNLN